MVDIDGIHGTRQSRNSREKGKGGQQQDSEFRDHQKDWDRHPLWIELHAFHVCAPSRLEARKYFNRGGRQFYPSKDWRYLLPLSTPSRSLIKNLFFRCLCNRFRSFEDRIRERRDDNQSWNDPMYISTPPPPPSQ